MILIVEEDEEMRSALEAILVHWGYPVLAVSNSVEGLNLYRKQLTEIRLVISNISQNTNSLEDLRQLRTMNGNARVIFEGNCFDAETRRSLASEGAAGFLFKPYTPEELRRVLSSELGDPPTP